jgi:hypothetical protein
MKKHKLGLSFQRPTQDAIGELPSGGNNGGINHYALQTHGDVVSFPCRVKTGRNFRPCQPLPHMFTGVPSALPTPMQPVSLTFPACW